MSDFSLVAGGPLYRLWRRTRLSGDALELPQRRVLALVVLIWVPLLVLSMIDGRAWGNGVALPFLHDIETHLRLLIAAPLLILAEVVVHRSLLPIVRQFVDNGLIRDEARAQFDAAIASALRLRNSVVVELLLVVFVYAVGMPLVWRDQLALDVNSWYATVGGRRACMPTNAGRWLVYVSMPVLQFLTLRWYFRFFVWGRFLWQVSRTRLNLEPTHPDGTAGLLFLARSGRAYRFVLLALGTMLSGMIANRIFHAGAKLLEFKVEIVGAVAVLVLLVLGPLIVFYPQLRAARRQGMIDYGTLGPGLRARVQPQVAARPTPRRRAIPRQRRLPVTGGPAQRLRGGARYPTGAVHHEERHVAGGDRAAAGGAAGADDGLRGAADRSLAEGALLRASAPMTGTASDRFDERPDATPNPRLQRTPQRPWRSSR